MQVATTSLQPVGDVLPRTKPNCHLRDVHYLKLSTPKNPISESTRHSLDVQVVVLAVLPPYHLAGQSEQSNSLKPDNNRCTITQRRNLETDRVVTDLEHWVHRMGRSRENQGTWEICVIDRDGPIFEAHRSLSKLDFPRKTLSSLLLVAMMDLAIAISPSKVLRQFPSWARQLMVCFSKGLSRTRLNVNMDMQDLTSLKHLQRPTRLVHFFCISSASSSAMQSRDVSMNMHKSKWYTTLETFQNPPTVSF